MTRLRVIRPVVATGGAFVATLVVLAGLAAATWSYGPPYTAGQEISSAAVVTLTSSGTFTLTQSWGPSSGAYNVAQTSYSNLRCSAGSAYVQSVGGYESGVFAPAIGHRMVATASWAWGGSSAGGLYSCTPVNGPWTAWTWVNVTVTILTSPGLAVVGSNSYVLWHYLGTWATSVGSGTKGYTTAATATGGSYIVQTEIVMVTYAANAGDFEVYSTNTVNFASSSIVIT